MSKSEKLNRRLMELEVEYRALLRKELEKLAVGGYSSYLYDLQSKYPIGKFWRRRYREIERLEEKIVELSRKLGVGLKESAVRIAQEFANQHRAVRESEHWRAWWKGQSQAVAKELLTKLLTIKRSPVPP
ncbi:MAG: hypothetical protein HY717_10865 [Planctomycetes bacterium]|nr:hypothetical protein [Planctomycetota bacterium]